MLRDKLGYQEI